MIKDQVITFNRAVFGILVKRLGAGKGFRVNTHGIWIEVVPNTLLQEKQNVKIARLDKIVIQQLKEVSVAQLSFGGMYRR